MENNAKTRIIFSVYISWFAPLIDMFSKNLKGIYVTEANGNNQTTKMWKLK